MNQRSSATAWRAATPRTRGRHGQSWLRVHAATRVIASIGLLHAWLVTSSRHSSSSFGTTPAHELGRIAIEAALEQAGVKGEEVDEVIMGQVLTAAQGQNPARQASMAAGVPKEVPAWGVNQVCGSGLRAVVLAHQQIATGSANIVVAGGQESMTNAPHVATIRQGKKLGDILRDLRHVAEGVKTTKSAFDLANKLGVDMPITRECYAVLYEDKPVKEALRDLMGRELGPEFHHA